MQEMSRNGQAHVYMLEVPVDATRKSWILENSNEIYDVNEVGLKVIVLGDIPIPIRRYLRL
jgi:hypothetical protein